MSLLRRLSVAALGVPLAVCFAARAAAGPLDLSYTYAAAFVVWEGASPWATGPVSEPFVDVTGHFSFTLPGAPTKGAALPYAWTTEGEASVTCLATTYWLSGPVEITLGPDVSDFYGLIKITGSDYTLALILGGSGDDGARAWVSDTPEDWLFDLQHRNGYVDLYSNPRGEFLAYSDFGSAVAEGPHMQPVPESASPGALLLLGLGGAAWLRRRQSTKAAG